MKGSGPGSSGIHQSFFKNVKHIRLILRPLSLITPITSEIETGKQPVVSTREKKASPTQLQHLLLSPHLFFFIVKLLPWPLFVNPFVFE